MDGNLTHAPAIEVDGLQLVLQRDGENYVRTFAENSIDYTIVQSWLSLCRQHHTSNCTRRDVTGVPSLRLIDCRTGLIVPAKKPPLYHAELHLGFI